jgi:hypothetical protein
MWAPTPAEVIDEMTFGPEAWGRGTWGTIPVVLLSTLLTELLEVLEVVVLLDLGHDVL